MNPMMVIRDCFLAAAVLALPLRAFAGVNLPAGFESVPITPALNQPVAMAFAPDARCFVAEQRGVVKVFKGGDQIATFIDLRDEVNFTAERGMLGIAVDPDFLTNRYVYLMYTVDPVAGAPNEPDGTATFARVVRYKGTGPSNGNVAGPNSRKVLLGAVPAEGIPNCWKSHIANALRFAPDKSLLISTGDAARFEFPDPGGHTPQCFQPPLFDSGQDIGAFRSQSLDSLAGKILRVHHGNGDGLSTNPFWDGDPHSNRSKIWAYGLRNPFRFGVKPGPYGGVIPPLFVADVGWDTREELNVVLGGENFGWPCYEGPLPAPDYPNLDPANSGCDTIGQPGNPGPLTPPLLSIHHTDPGPDGFTSQSIIGGVFHVGENYPEPYRGGYFFADFIENWIKILKIDENNQITEILDFATQAEGPVDFALHPVNASICYISLLDEKVMRIRYVGSGLQATEPVDGLLAVLSAWGPCQPGQACTADLTDDDVVDVDDLIRVLQLLGQ